MQRFVYILGATASAFVFGRSNSMHAFAQGVTLPPLPYAYDALEPVIDQETLRVHHDKHHAKYVDVASGIIKGTEMEQWDVVRILRAAHGNNPGLFNNAAQSYNHEFYWNCMKPNGGGRPTGRVAKLIDEAFGSFADFRGAFTSAGMSTFGSGWVWLVWTPSGLKISKTIGAENPLTNDSEVPILTMDVWEHAYYLKYKNMRATYCDNFVDSLINWDFVEAQIPSNSKDL